jgi:OOP family OmpA-OmpF porin
MDKRILAVLIATLAGAGAASAQPAYLTSGATGAAVSNGFGGCWQTGAAGSKAALPCPAPRLERTAATGASPARQQLAQADSAGRYRAPAAGAGASRAATSVAAANDGYVISNGATAPLVNAEGQCVHSGSWTPSKAAEPCDVVPRASAPAPVVAAAPEPQPAPAPLAQAAPPAPVIEKVTLSTDVLFPFNKAELLPGGRDKLNQLAKDAQGAEVDKVVLAGYADRIGGEEYNRDLSERRAQAVADYLTSQGVDQSHIQVEGHGKDNPVTGDQCKNMGPAKASNQKLVACLQPDRRVEAELLGSREVASGSSAPSGATSSGTSGSSTGAGASSSGSSTR